MHFKDTVPKIEKNIPINKIGNEAAQFSFWNTLIWIFWQCGVVLSAKSI